MEFYRKIFPGKILSNPERSKNTRMGDLENKLKLGKYNIKVKAYILIYYIIFTFYILLSKTGLFVSWFCFEIEFTDDKFLLNQNHKHLFKKMVL
jgi:hypothetical protein